MQRAWQCVGVLLLGTLAAATAAPTVLDDCSDPNTWQVLPSDGVQATLAVTEGPDGPALQLDYDFSKGMGFVVLRRKLDLGVAENFRFTFLVRGAAPANNLEFKLVDPSGDNVWWLNRREFAPPAQWQKLTQKARHIEFAWGPQGGGRPKQLGALEFAIAAANGGKGTICFDELTYEALPAPQPVTKTPVVRASSSASPDQPREWQLAPHQSLAWHSSAEDATPTLTIDLGQFRELGGLCIDWDENAFGGDYSVAGSAAPDQGWETLRTVSGGNSGRDYVALPDAEAAYLRLTITRASGDAGVGVRGLRVLDVGFGNSPNDMFATIAKEAPRGWYPRYCLDQQAYWTIVGVAGDDNEALLDTDGAIELAKRGPRLEPFVFANDRLYTWADVQAAQSLADGYLPIPSVRWQLPEGLTLEVTAVADGQAGDSALLVRYLLTNNGATPQSGKLFVALRPFQVLPPWQRLNLTGGFAAVHDLRTSDAGLSADGREIAVLDERVGGVATFAGGEIVEHLAKGELPPAKAVHDEDGLASGALAFDFDLPAGRARTVVLHVPLSGQGYLSPHSNAAKVFEDSLTRVSATWRDALNRVQLHLPPSATPLVDTFRATQAYILINAEGPAIQPGSRTYERSWARDGSLTSTALLYTGHADAVRAFIDWFAPYQYESGKVPCVVDKRGPDPVPEHDSQGQLIYILYKYYRFTGDKTMLERHFGRVVRAVDYIESLRAQRMTAEYLDGPPEKRALYGLVTESISHEGYSAKPMHSYWDSFFVVRGLKDAAAIAHVLSKTAEEQRFTDLLADYRRCLYDSVRLAMKNKNVDYFPGCAELGDFDATSTAIGIYPCGELCWAPDAAIKATFDRYYQFCCDRRDGKLDWHDYTPYELRTLSAYILLDQPERAHALLDFFMHDQRPPAWHEWAEVVWRDPNMPRFIGDMPHTWVGSEFVQSLRNMLVYERDNDASLVLAAGVQPAWLSEAQGVEIRGFPTAYGTLTYALRSAEGELHLTLDATGAVPPGGFVLHLPQPLALGDIVRETLGATLVGERDVKLTQLKGELVVRLK